MLERRKDRRIALEILYQLEITGNLLNEVLENRLNVAKCRPISDFCLRIVKGVDEHRSQIDKIIETYADNWLVERMPILDRNVIRISLFEMLYEPDIPFSVSINEAVELAKVYGTVDSSKFVNGVLGKIASDLKSDAARVSKKS